MVSDYLLDNPKESFCQALHTLNIINQDEDNFNYYDTDEEVVERMKEKTLTL